MDKKKVLLTQKGYESVKAELDRLTKVERADVIRELAEARAQGDLSENADYDAARDKQRDLEAKIQRYQYMVDNVEIIENTDADIVKAGMTVTYLDLSDSIYDTVTIVGTFETDPENGKISDECPLAKALMDHTVGETVNVEVENAYSVTILDISFNENSEITDLPN